MSKQKKKPNSWERNRKWKKCLNKQRKGWYRKLSFDMSYRIKKISFFLWEIESILCSSLNFIFASILMIFPFSVSSNSRPFWRTLENFTSEYFWWNLGYFWKTFLPFSNFPLFSVASCLSVPIFGIFFSSKHYPQCFFSSLQGDLLSLSCSQSQQTWNCIKGMMFSFSDGHGSAFRVMSRVSQVKKCQSWQHLFLRREKERKELSFTSNCPNWCPRKMDVLLSKLLKISCFFTLRVQESRILLRGKSLFKEETQGMTSSLSLCSRLILATHLKMGDNQKDTQT